jgi:hypothetical protein
MRVFFVIYPCFLQSFGHFIQIYGAHHHHHLHVQCRQNEIQITVADLTYQISFKTIKYFSGLYMQISTTSICYFVLNSKTTLVQIMKLQLNVQLLTYIITN